MVVTYRGGQLVEHDWDEQALLRGLPDVPALHTEITARTDMRPGEATGRAAPTALLSDPHVVHSSNPAEKRTLMDTAHKVPYRLGRVVCQLAVVKHHETTLEVSFAAHQQTSATNRTKKKIALRQVTRLLHGARWWTKAEQPPCSTPHKTLLHQTGTCN